MQTEMIRLFHGKNRFLSYNEVHKQLENLEKEYEKSNKSYEIRVIDASTADANQIINEIETPDLLLNRKIILLKRPYSSQDSDQLIDFITLKAESSSKDDLNDLLIWEDQKLRSNSKLVKIFKKKDLLYESPEFNKRTFQTWAKETLSESEIDISNPAVHLLSERVNYEPERLVREISKLQLIKTDEISEEDIEKTCPDTLEHSIWELIDSINDGDSRSAGKTLNLVLNQGNDPFYVLLMIARNLRITLLAKYLLERGQSPTDIAKRIKTPPFTINKIRRTAQDTSYAKIKTIYEKLNNIDYSGKTGQLDVELALNILLSVI